MSDKKKSNDFGTNYETEQFVVLNHEALWHPELSLKAVGLWARCRSFAPTWTFYKCKIISDGKEKRTAIESAFKELERAGLMVIIVHRIIGEKDGKKINRIWGNEYVFFKCIKTQEEIQKIITERREAIKKMFLEAGFLQTAKLYEGKQHLTNTNGIYKKRESSEEAVHESVQKEILSEFQIKNLKKISPEEFEEAYQFMLEQKNEIPNPYGWLRKCLTLKWHKKAAVKESLRSSSKEFGMKVIEKYSPFLLANSSFEISEEAFLINRGTKTFKIGLNEVNFQEKVNGYLKEMGLIK